MMFRRLIGNTIVSGVASLLTGAVNMLLVPVLVTGYGLVGYGILMLARVFMPTGALSVFDVGAQETTAQFVARARVSGDWAEAGRRLALMLASVAMLGALLSAVLLMAADTLATGMTDNTTHAAQLSMLISCTAVSLPILFPALVAEGVLKGFERFKALRSIDVAVAIIYGSTIVWLVLMNRASLVAVGMIYLVLQVARVLGISFLAHRLTSRAGVKLGRWTAPDFEEVRDRAVVMSKNKVLGAMQHQAAPLLIGWWIGAAGVGLYDVLTRLPRFLKSMLGLANTALLPLAARLDQQGNSDGLKQLGSHGLSLVTAASLTMLIAGAALSQPLLALWVGAPAADYWQWSALMFLVPALNVVTSFGGTPLLVRVEWAAAMNRLVATQLLVYLVTAVLLLPYFEERAFIFGQVAGVASSFIGQMRLITRAYGLSRDVTTRVLAMLVISTIGVAILAWLVGRMGPPNTWVAVAVLAVLVVAGFGPTLWGAGLTGETRALVVRAVRDAYASPTPRAGG